MTDNIQITELEVDGIILTLLQLYSDDVELNAGEFLDLLKHSLSLNTMEKKRVIDATPTLSQFQLDELTKVFVEERIKFRELAKEHPEDIKKLLGKQQLEWIQLGDIYKNEQNSEEQAGVDEEQIDNIKAQLGL